MQKNKIDIETVRALHQAGDLGRAKEGYLAILENSPQENESFHALILNNLGTIYYKQNNLNAAIDAYRQAISIQPDYIDAYYNLGLALTKNEFIEDAESVYKKIVEFSPNHDAARFQLGCIFMRKGEIELAISEFLWVEESKPYHFETQTNLATCYLKKGALQEAKKYYESALSLVPNDEQSLFNLGVIAMRQGFIDQAIQYYQRTIRVNPDLFSAQNNLGVAFLERQQPGLALQHFREALRLQPLNKAIAHTVNLLSQDNKIFSAPEEYIRSLFDSYADHYEPHLLNALDYKIPSIFESVLSEIIPSRSLFDILDLGCGTGLCGDLFKPQAKTLTGVDLSPKMLEIAAEKNCYDLLVESDASSFLNGKKNQYDLILAGDVLVYIGKLDLFFEQVKQALRSQGVFIFNTEISNDGDFKLNQSGRFSHNKNYLDALIQKSAFTVLEYQTVVTRNQHNGPVLGHLYVLQK